MKFISNPSNGTIQEVTPGVYYIYNAHTSSWNRLAGLDQYNIATQTKNGLMSKDDLKKINDLIIPPPQTTIKGELCEFTYKSGKVGLYPGDDFIQIDDSLKSFSADGVITEPWNLHLNTVGIDWKLDLTKLFAELDKRGNLTKRAIQGDTGKTGDKGDPGQDNLDTGPVGEDGPNGLNAPWQGTAIPEAIKLEAINPNSNKAIVDIYVESTDDGYYLVVKRANIGSANAVTDKVNFGDFSSPWLMIIDYKPSSPQKTIVSSGCDEKLVCRFAESSVYYLNIDPILDAFENRFNVILDQLKQGKEQIVIEWLKNMISMFVAQKSALCCALENCRSKKRNASERHFIEGLRVQAAQANLNISLESDKKEIIDMNKDCVITSTSADTGIGSVTFGDENDCLDCAVKVVLDGATNAGTIANSIGFDLPSGKYVVTIDDCCANNSTITNRWHGRVDISYNHQVVTNGLPGPVRTEIISTPDCGEYSSQSEALAKYQGATIQFTHAGGTIHAWIPDTYPQDNAGSIVLCFRKLECYDVTFGSGPDPAELNETIYVYKDSISEANYLGSILPYTGNLSASDNYGYGIATDPDGPGITNGCTPTTTESALFFYDGVDGLSFFTINGNTQISQNTVSYDYEVENGTQTMRVLVSDESNELVDTGIDTFSGNWQQNGDGDGGVIGYFSNEVNAPWIFSFIPNSSGSIKILKVCSRDGNTLYLPAPTGKTSTGVSVLGNTNYWDNPVGGISFAAGDGLKFIINGSVGFGGALRAPGKNSVFSNRTTFAADGKKLNNPSASSTATDFYVGQFFLSLTDQHGPNTFNQLHHKGPLGLVMKFVYDDGSVDEIMPLTHESIFGLDLWRYSSAPAFVLRDQTLVAKHNSFFQSSPICDTTAYANATGAGGWATSQPSTFYGQPNFDEYCSRMLISYIRPKKSGKVYFYVNDHKDETSQGAAFTSPGVDPRNVGQYDVLIDQCAAEHFDSNLGVIPTVTVENNALDLAWTSSFCEGGDLSDDVGKILFTKIRDGCTLSWQQIEWTERGWRIGACCGAYVELNGQTWLIVKRSLGIDTSCGGGESLNNDCIRTHIGTIGHPAFAWPSIDGDEFFGRPTSGSTTFLYDKALSDAIVQKINDGDILAEKGNPAGNVTVVLFPKLD